MFSVLTSNGKLTLETARTLSLKIQFTKFVVGRIDQTLLPDLTDHALVNNTPEYPILFNQATIETATTVVHTGLPQDIVYLPIRLTDFFIKCRVPQTIDMYRYNVILIYAKVNNVERLFSINYSKVMNPKFSVQENVAGTIHWFIQTMVAHDRDDIFDFTNVALETPEFQQVATWDDLLDPWNMEHNQLILDNHTQQPFNFEPNTKHMVFNSVDQFFGAYMERWEPNQAARPHTISMTGRQYKYETTAYPSSVMPVNGYNGILYTPSDSDTLYTDLFGSAKASSDGDRIAIMLDSHNWGGKSLAQHIAAQPELWDDLTAAIPAGVTYTTYDATTKKFTIYNSGIAEQKPYVRTPVVLERNTVYAVTLKIYIEGPGTTNSLAVQHNTAYGSYSQLVFENATVTLFITTNDEDMPLEFTCPISGSSLSISNISVKLIEGYHAIQPVEINRPVYRLTPEILVENSTIIPLNNNEQTHYHNLVPGTNYRVVIKIDPVGINEDVGLSLYPDSDVALSSNYVDGNKTELYFDFVATTEDMTIVYTPQTGSTLTITEVGIYTISAYNKPCWLETISLGQGFEIPLHTTNRYFMMLSVRLNRNFSSEENTIFGTLNDDGSRFTFELSEDGAVSYFPVLFGNKTLASTVIQNKDILVMQRAESSYNVVDIDGVITDRHNARKLLPTTKMRLMKNILGRFYGGIITDFLPSKNQELILRRFMSGATGTLALPEGMKIAVDADDVPLLDRFGNRMLVPESV